MKKLEGRHRDDIELITKDKIEKQIGKEELTAKHFAIYTGVDEKTIKNYIKRFCKMDNGLKESDFMKNGKYIIKPEIQGIFISLMEVYKFKNGDKDKESKKQKKRTSEELNEEIEAQLAPEDREKFQAEEVYSIVNSERQFVDNYFLEWYMLTETIFKIKNKSRIGLLRSFTKTISNIRKSIVIRDNVTERQIDKTRKVTPAYYLLDETMAGDIEDWLISQMARKLREEKINKEIDEYKEKEIYNEKDVGRIMYELLYKNSFDEKIIQGYVFPLERREELRQKVDSVFDLTDEIESEIAQFIKDTFDEVHFGPILREKKEKEVDIQGFKREMYKSFFNKYEAFSQSVEIVKSDEYKDYLKIKDTEELKALIRKYNEK